MSVESDIFQYRFIGIVAEGHVLEDHVALHIGHIDRALGVGGLGLLVHYRENALRARKSGEDRRGLLGDIVYWHAELLGILCEELKRTGVESAHYHEYAADAYGDRVADHARVVHDRTHNAAVELRLHLLVAEILVESLEFLAANVLVVEDLDDLLSRNGLLDVSVSRAECRLLTRVIFSRCSRDLCAADREEGNEGDRDQSQPGVSRYHEHESSDKRDNARNYAGKRVVEHNVDVVDVVRKSRHDLARGVSVEIADGKLLQLLEKVVSDLFDRVLRDSQHNSRLKIVGKYGENVNADEDHYSRRDIEHYCGCFFIEPVADYAADKADCAVLDRANCRVERLIDRAVQRLLVDLKTDVFRELIYDRSGHIAADERGDGIDHHEDEHYE